VTTFQKKNRQCWGKEPDTKTEEEGKDRLRTKNQVRAISKNSTQETASGNQLDKKLEDCPGVKSHLKTLRRGVPAPGKKRER